MLINPDFVCLENNVRIFYLNGWTSHRIDHNLNSSEIPCIQWMILNMSIIHSTGKQKLIELGQQP